MDIYVPMHIWAALTAFGGLFKKKNDMKLGRGGVTGIWEEWRGMG